MREKIRILLNKFWDGWRYWQRFDTSAINEQWTPKIEDIWNYSAHFCFQSMDFWQADHCLGILTRNMTTEMRSRWMWTDSRHQIHNQPTSCCLSVFSLGASQPAQFLSSGHQEMNKDPSFWWNTFFVRPGISRDLFASLYPSVPVVSQKCLGYCLRW